MGEPVDKMYEMIEVVNDILPKDKPRYLMGVGTPVNILEGNAYSKRSEWNVIYQGWYYKHA